MAATETRSSDGVVYVKRDLYPMSSSAIDDDEDIADRRHERRRRCDDEDDVDDRPPILKLARYNISPTVPSLLALHHHHGYVSNAYGDQLTSPIPRRKQARPRRRSGDSSSSPPSSSSLMAMEHHRHFQSMFRSTPSPVQDMPEDLSVKKSSPMNPVTKRPESEDNQSGRNSNDQDSHRSDTPLPVPSLKAESINSDSAKSEFSLAERNSLFSPGPSGVPDTMTTPSMHSSKMLSMTPIHQSDRRKGQHSAPRGGPPRAWTNGDLTEALNHVWNRKMTTSQASRVFGIPYNSLLMYVRGKYGKSLKLDTLRKETLEGEAMALAASTRGSYKLAAAAAAAAAATSPTHSNNGNSNNKTKQPKEGGGNKSAPSTPSPTVSAKSPNNNNNNNNNNNMNSHNHKNHNNNDVKTKNGPVMSGPSHLTGVYPPPQHRLNEMEALGMAGLAHAAGLSGFGGVNPYLSYFCDFSFPMPMGLGAGILQAATGAATGANKHHRAAIEHQGLLLKKSSKPSSKHHRNKLNKSAMSDVQTDDVKTDKNDEGSNQPHRLNLPMIRTPLDHHQAGQV